VLTRVAYRQAKRRGIEVLSLAQQAGITREAIEDWDATLGVVNQIKFVELVAQAVGDELLGFHLAKSFDFREIGLLYYVAASADTLGSALRRAERYVKIQNDGLRFKVSRGRSVRVRLHYAGVARYTDSHQIGSTITVLIRICRHLTHRSLKPTSVHIMHRIPSGKSELRTLLDADVEDGADVDAIEFPAGCWDLPIVSTDPYLHRILVRSCEEALARRIMKPRPLEVRVENEIATLLPHGQASRERVAAKLGMSSRSLARCLAAEGLSFTGILSNMRLALADRYLADPRLAISQVAWLLGYTEISTFTNAFQRWTGIPPSAARAQQRRPASSVSV
jgi:AraC-like DNA-binding protein